MEFDQPVLPPKPRNRPLLFAPPPFGLFAPQRATPEVPEDHFVSPPDLGGRSSDERGFRAVRPKLMIVAEVIARWPLRPARAAHSAKCHAIVSELLALREMCGNSRGTAHFCRSN